MSEEFYHTITRTEVTRWYAIEGVPVFESIGSVSVKPILPVSARFVFVDGDFYTLMVNGQLLKKDGSVSDRVVHIRDIYSWNQSNWPDWLKRLRDLAFAEFEAEGK